MQFKPIPKMGTHALDITIDHEGKEHFEWLYESVNGNIVDQCESHDFILALSSKAQGRTVF